MPKTDRERLQDNNTSILRIKEKANNLPDAKINVTSGTVDGHTLILSNTPPAPVLPYVELEYIQSTGTQYIDTNITFNQNIDFSADFQLTELSSDDCGIIGARINAAYGTADANKYRCGLIQWTNKFHFMFPDGNGVWNNDTDLLRHKIKCYSENQGWKLEVDNTDTYTISNVTLEANNTHYYIFKNDRNYTSKMKLYSAKFYNAKTLVLDLIPVKRRSDNEICLYDKVTETFFTNQGTDNFLAGPVVEEKPYIELEYIESTGTQYIDTGIYPTTINKIDTSAMFTSAVDNRIFGARYSLSGDKCVIGVNYTVSSIENKIQYGYGSDSWRTLEYTYIPVNKYFNVIFEFVIDGSSGKITLDGTSYNVTSESGISQLNNTSIYLFAINTPYLESIQQFGIARIYNCKMYGYSGSLVRDFIPVKRKNDNEICMYDKVTNQFFINQGTGSFIAGPEIN